MLGESTYHSLMSTTRKPIIIRSKPLSTYEVAEILGVSRRRTEELIAMAREGGRKSSKGPKRAAGASGAAPVAAPRYRTRKTPVVAGNKTPIAAEQAVGD
jgi:hypothetical protein